MLPPPSIATCCALVLSVLLTSDVEPGSMLTVATVPVPPRPMLPPVVVPVTSRVDASAPGVVGWKVTLIRQSTVVSPLEVQLGEPLCEKSGLDRKSTRLNSSHLVISYA